MNSTKASLLIPLRQQNPRLCSFADMSRAVYQEDTIWLPRLNDYLRMTEGNHSWTDFCEYSLRNSTENTPEEAALNWWRQIK
ncbi:hypothetical protein IMZ31_19760 (plasmid) [Pontibacillus sp. ALD_SL1]|uniref:hypothetical protein n=1 Tax=Pontibacillus sp. ALD_SL1 TaxID=2777185 RepID=UPI001A967891|nr:hypothetical protein [Pontibacillus sp. ALD_SL1]QST02788.1 hypothetical protein IMZ31_19760 [Pontibacillus sp. ALD_SL1]